MNTEIGAGTPPKPTIADINSHGKGNWYSILTSLGVEPRLLSGKSLPCPACHAGKDRFRWDRLKEAWICNTCTAHTSHKFRDGFNLLSVCLGIENKEAIKLVAKFLGLSFNQSVISRPLLQFQAKNTAQDQHQEKLSKKGTGAIHAKAIIAQCVIGTHPYLQAKGLNQLVRINTKNYTVTDKQTVYAGA